MQVHVRPNMSDPFPEKIVRERLTGSSAFYGERLRDRVSYAVVANHTILGMERNLQVPLPFIRHIDVPFAVSGNSNDRP